jgi:hypothetical protein
VAAEVSAVDDGVGTVMETLNSHGLAEDTVVIFAGDQGWMGGQNGFFGMGDHTRPFAAHDLMMHVPLIFHYPTAISPGETDIMVSNTDFLPTVLDVLSLGHRLPEEPHQKLSGRRYARVLRGEDTDWETAMYYEMEGCRSVRTENWKYVARRSPDGPGELYHMANDPHERLNRQVSSMPISQHMQILNMTSGRVVDRRQDGCMLRKVIPTIALCANRSTDTKTAAIAGLTRTFGLFATITPTERAIHLCCVQNWSRQVGATPLSVAWRPCRANDSNAALGFAVCRR